MRCCYKLRSFSVKSFAFVKMRIILIGNVALDGLSNYNSPAFWQGLLYPAKKRG